MHRFALHLSSHISHSLQVNALHLAWKKCIDTKDLGVVDLYGVGAIVYATFKTTLSTPTEIEGYFAGLNKKDALSVSRFASLFIRFRYAFAIASIYNNSLT